MEQVKDVVITAEWVLMRQRKGGRVTEDMADMNGRWTTCDAKGTIT
jgi:hypothetical protein